MSTDDPTNALSHALFGRVRRALLALLFSNSEDDFYLRQIVRIAGVGQGAVQRELDNLTRAGLITRRKQGRHGAYRDLDPLQFLAELTAHIARPFERVTNYHDRFSNRSRRLRNKLQASRCDTERQARPPPHEPIYIPCDFEQR